MTIFTIGYEGLGIDEFLLLLHEHDIETVVDVRELPLSRKPGFSKKALEATINHEGCRYVHMVALGCPKAIRNGYRNDGSWKRYAGRFQKYLATQSAALTALAQLAMSKRCALLCFEADFKVCHRAIVANAVAKIGGQSVRHIRPAVLE